MYDKLKKEQEQLYQEYLEQIAQLNETIAALRAINKDIESVLQGGSVISEVGKDVIASEE